MQRKVLILEDEESIRSFIVINLKRAGYDVVEAETGEEALEKLKNTDDIAIAMLDVMLPGIDGFEVCRRIRDDGKTIGIIMLTARGQETDKVTGLMTGADDYVTKPFSVTELIARVDALFRRTYGTLTDSSVLESNGFQLDVNSRELKKNGHRIDLTQVEFEIMKTFLQNKNKAMSREEILGIVWGSKYLGDPKIVDVNIRRLRMKIEDNPAQPRFISTLWGFGYKWEG